MAPSILGKRRNGNGHHANWQEVEDERPLSEVLGDLTAHVQQLVRGEVALVKQEAVDNAKKLAVYAGMGAGAAIFALLTLVFLGHAIAQALNGVMDAWVAFLIVTLLYAVIATALAFAAKKGIDKQQVAPEDSIDQAKEDLQWIKQHRN